MDAMDRLNMRSEYQILNDAIKDEIRRSASSVVSLGYMLRRMMDEKLWEGHYDSLDEYLRQELHMDYTLACRFEAINRKYSIGGKNVHIADKWENYSQSVLIEMLNMPPELETKVTPDMTVRQVRELKRQARQERKKRGMRKPREKRRKKYPGHRHIRDTGRCRKKRTRIARRKEAVWRELRRGKSWMQNSVKWKYLRRAPYWIRNRGHRKKLRRRN